MTRFVEMSTWRRVADGGWCKFGSLVPDRISCLGSMDLGSPDDSYDGRILCSAGWWILIKKEEDGIKNAGARGCALLAPRISISINRRRCKMHFSTFYCTKTPVFKWDETKYINFLLLMAQISLLSFQYLSLTPRGRPLVVNIFFRYIGG